VSVDVVLAWHVHQPRFVPEDELLTQARESYRPLVEAHRETGVPVCFNVTGSLLDRLARAAPALVGDLRDSVEEGLVEPLASGYEHPLLPLLPYRSAEHHVRRDITSTRDHLGTEPTGFWPTDLGWVHWLVPLLRELGIEWTVVDGPSVAQANVLPAWESTTEGEFSVLEPLVEATTAERQFHRPYAVTFCDETLGVLPRNHERSVGLFGDHLSGDGPGALYDEAELDRWVADLVEAPGEVVVVAEDGERINPQTVRLYRRLLERLDDHEDIHVRGGSAALEGSDPGHARFLPAATFQYDLRAWAAAMDDWTYLYFLDRAQREVTALERRIGPARGEQQEHDRPELQHLRRARDQLLQAEDSGVVFWRFADRTRSAGYEAAFEAYREARRGLEAIRP
jgi:alpha-amylase/alpha-mannosidase (GH57 family)